MSLLSDFQYSFANDPIYRRKTFFFAGVGAVAVLIVAGFIYANLPTTNQTAVVPKLELKPKVEVTTKNFDDAGFEAVTKEKLAYTNGLFFGPKSELAYVNKGLNLSVDGKVTELKTGLLASKIYFGSEGVVVNENGASSYVGVDGKLVAYPSGIFQVLPVITDAKTSASTYYFLDRSADPVKLFQATKLDLSDKKLVFDIGFGEGKKYSLLELRQFGTAVYLVGYESASKTGNIDVYSFKDGKVNLVKELKKTLSIVYGANQLAYTDLLAKPNELTLYKTTVVDFSGSALNEKVIDVNTKLGTDSIYGNIFAERCGFDKLDTIYCLIKKNRVNQNLVKETDTLAKIGWKTGKVEYLLGNNIFSGSSVSVAPDGKIYLVGQENGLVYRLK
jgi:hypothetical protein